MTYQRVDYTTHKGAKSSAYYDELTQSAYDVFTQHAVAITQNPVTGLYSEWVPTPVRAQDHVANKVQQITIKPNVSPWMIVPTGLFGIGCIWLEMTFHLFRK